MKWGKRKNKLSSPSSSPSPSIISRVLPISWFSKLRRNSEASWPPKNKPKEHLEISPNSKLKRGIRFYTMDEDDPFRRFSFSDERIPARRSTGGTVNPLSHDLDHKCRFSVSSLGVEPSFPKREGSRNLNGVVRHIKRTKERERSKQTIKDDIFGIDHQSSRKPRRSKWSESEEVDVFLSKPEDVSNMAVSNISKQWKYQILGLEEGNVGDSERPSLASEWQDLRKGNDFFKEIKPHKPKVNGGKAKSYSPRTACKIRALEEMKQTRTKTEKGKTEFKDFAVMKTSSDPHQDFRDSMVAMIREKGICRPGDLEDLLACYLGLNSKEYHDVIISAFRKVWFELKDASCF